MTELRIAELLLDGMWPKQIARELRMPHRTMKLYLNRMYQARGICSGHMFIKLAVALYAERDKGKS